MSTVGEDTDSSIIFFFNSSNITDWIGEVVFHRNTKMISLQPACFGFTDFSFFGGRKLNTDIQSPFQTF